MSVTLDTGNSATKTSNDYVPPRETTAKETRVKTTATDPAATGAVALKQADAAQTAEMTKTALVTGFTSATPDPAQEADRIIGEHGGTSHLDTDAVGHEVANLALTDPTQANLVGQQILDKIEGRDRDEVAQSFAESLTDAQLTELAKDADGKALLERAKDHLLSGSVHRDERATALKITNGIQGYPTPQLTGNHEVDVQTVADDLRGLPPEKQAEYIAAVMEHPYGIETLQRAGYLSADDQKVLAEALGSAYEADPNSVNGFLRDYMATDKDFNIAYWTGFAEVIAQTGNDNLIASYADKAIDAASANPEHEGLSVDAMAALAGMSPAALQNFINFRSTTPPMSGDLAGIGRAIEANSAQFHSVLGNAVGWLDADANNIGMFNPWALNPALGNLLDTVSKMTGRNGQPTEDAMKIFEAIATSTGDNFYTKEAAGRFFIEHGQAVVDRFAALRNPDGSVNTNRDPEVLQKFFAGVVYSPISSLLEYNGASMVEAIMGNGEGNDGVIGEISGNIMDRAANGGDPADAGREIGYLFGAMSGGFLDSVQAYKDQFNEDKEFREFLYKTASFGLGSLGKKAGIPLDKIAGFAEKLYEAEKSKERKAKLETYLEAFTDLKDAMDLRLLEFENNHAGTDGLEDGFVLSWTELMAEYLAGDWITK